MGFGKTIPQFMRWHARRGGHCGFVQGGGGGVFSHPDHDLSKAFDYVDHEILVHKLYTCESRGDHLNGQHCTSVTGGSVSTFPFVFRI